MFPPSAAVAAATGKPQSTTPETALDLSPAGPSTVPWREDGVVEEVLEHLEEHAVVLLLVLHLRRLGAVAALDAPGAGQVGFGGLGAVLQVH